MKLPSRAAQEKDLIQGLRMVFSRVGMAGGDPPDIMMQASLQQVKVFLVGSNWFVSVMYPGRKPGMNRFMFERIIGDEAKVPSRIYHATARRNVPSILKRGLEPRTGTDWGYPPRIYFSDSQKMAKTWSDKKGDMVALVVDTEEASVPFYMDDQFAHAGKFESYYTNLPIAPGAITGVKEIR